VTMISAPIRHKDGNKENTELVIISIGFTFKDVCWWNARRSPAELMSIRLL